MKTELFDYELPQASIAQEPPAERDGGRLLVLAASGSEHRMVRDFPALVPEGALVVLNDTRVIRARLLGTRRATGGRAEIFLLRHEGGTRWLALGRASKTLREGSIVDAGPIAVHVRQRLPGGELAVELSSSEPLDSALDEVGHVPLPPYVRRPDTAADRERYQTVYAERSGSVAAPTAGLHLSERLLEELAGRVEIGRVTLHVGLGTFQPVTSEDLDDHAMHSEPIEVGTELASQVAAARARGAPVVAVGTTVVRALESASDPERDGHVRAWSGDTRLLIQPGYRFRVVDSLLTNFHMPRSTLLALVSAFAGRERVLSAYRDALARGYRFLSYGDAMWIPERAR